MSNDGIRRQRTESAASQTDELLMRNVFAVLLFNIDKAWALNCFFSFLDFGVNLSSTVSFSKLISLTKSSIHIFKVLTFVTLPWLNVSHFCRLENIRNFKFLNSKKKLVASSPSNQRILYRIMQLTRMLDFLRQSISTLERKSAQQLLSPVTCYCQCYEY